MTERVAKSRKMAEPHAQNVRARVALGVRRGTGTCGDTARAGRERDNGRARGRRDGAGPMREAGAGGTRGGRARVRVRVAESIGRLAGWFDVWVQVMDQWIHHPRYIYIYIYIYNNIPVVSYNSDSISFAT
jgi:hypothetical protein